MTSRAAQYARYGGPEVLEIVEREDPQPGPGQVRLAVRAAGVNPADWKLRTGAFNPGDDAPERPVVPGFDVAGTVEALGEGVTTLAEGDEVLGGTRGGAQAERALADADALVAKPAALSWEVAGSLATVVSTAYRVLERLGVSPGQVLLVHGASGGVGIVATQVALARGITVIGSAGERHQDDVRALGATPVVHGDGLVDGVRAVTDRVDAVFDAAGRGSLADLVALAGGPDRVVTIAHPDAAEHGVEFSSGGGVDGALAEFVGQLAAGTFRAPEVVVYPLEEVGKAQEDNRTGAVSGKLVVIP
ncbi:NADP-dependent oxidoreductase [Actinomycetospora corticicola]|uniref:NADPH:quinone reductase-like Zn-dependent oxidoreductase n=1 Tax=Actinomycetospora corticicola TaxID=663602 RepID=A0A7Y9DWZ4_9PSEU|nr:NADP-dependent oxidoreductase [Actinomycetospora corticicola]NYD37039.1 NADPH:quinone reductase-like Zn-dependent oxidoreductase [Actinomycetospora corticicola]